VRATGRGGARIARAAIAVVGLLGFALLIFSIVGLLGLVSTPVGPVRQHLSPADLASSAVAGATLILAVFTAYLAMATRESVAATRREAAIAEQALAAAQEQARIGAEQVLATNRHAEIAQETLEASWRPILVDVPIGLFVVTSSSVFGSWDRGRVRVTEVGRPLQKLRATIPLRNVGSGPAIIVSSSLSIGDYKSIAAPEISAPIVPPAMDELTNIEFDIDVGRKDLGSLVDDLQKEGPDRPPWLVVVAYRDQAGSNLWRTEAHVYPSEEHRWYVRQVALVDGKTGRTVVMSGPKRPSDSKSE
jgi:hypothetical protein